MNLLTELIVELYLLYVYGLSVLDALKKVQRSETCSETYSITLTFLFPFFFFLSRKKSKFVQGNTEVATGSNKD